MSQPPIVYAQSKVFCPNTAFDQHPAVQQYIADIPHADYDRLRLMLVLRTADIKRLFGTEKVTGFYLIAPSGISYVMPRVSDLAAYKEEELIADIFAIPNNAMDQIIPCGVELLMRDFHNEYNDDEVPTLRMKVMIAGADALATNKPELAARLNVVDYATWSKGGDSIRFDFDLMHWIENPPGTDDNHDIVERKQIHLKDVPLDIRNGRRMVRASIEANGEALTNLFIKSGAQTTFDEWMVTSQGVNMPVLKELEKIDNLPDDQYVEAMVTFKKAEAQAYHSHAVKAGETDLHLFDWTLKHFGVEFDVLGRAEAMSEIISFDEPSAVEADDENVELGPAVFVVTFDGTIVEDRSPKIGPESPFAIPLLKKLIENGHQVIILTDRDNHDTRSPMLDFLKAGGVEVIGSVGSIPANGIIKGDTMHHVQSNDNVNKEWVMDYLIDHRQFGITTIQVSGRADHGSTLYWGGIVEQLQGLGYINQEDVDDIAAAMSEDQ